MKKILVFTTFLLSNSACLLPGRSPLDSTDNYRYYAIKPLMKQYQRPITFMHLWPHKSQVAIAVAQKYNCVSIMVDPQASSLMNVCSPHDNIVLLNHDLSIKDLRSLGECEHIDVTLVSNLAQTFPSDWKKAIDQVLTMGDYIIIEAPVASSKLYRPFIEYLRKNGGERISVPAYDIAHQAGELYQCAAMKKHLIKRRWNYKNSWHLGEYTIESSFIHKNFVKNKTKPKGYSITQWHPGINLYTFKQLQGIYPTHETIRAMLYPLASLKHNDLRIFNLIIQGTQLMPIDGNENERHADPTALLPVLIAHFRNRNIRLIQEFESPLSETCNDNDEEEEKLDTL